MLNKWVSSLLLRALDLVLPWANAVHAASGQFFRMHQWQHLRTRCLPATAAIPKRRKCLEPLATQRLSHRHPVPRWRSLSEPYAYRTTVREVPRNPAKSCKLKWSCSTSPHWLEDIAPGWVLGLSSNLHNMFPFAPSMIPRSPICRYPKTRKAQATTCCYFQGNQRTD